jgi:hypothetical protein
MKIKRLTFLVIFFLVACSNPSTQNSEMVSTDIANNSQEADLKISDLFSAVMTGDDFLEYNSTIRVDEEYTWQSLKSPEDLIESDWATLTTTPAECKSISQLYLPSKDLIEQEKILGYSHSQYAIFPGDNPTEFAQISKSAQFTVAEQQILILSNKGLAETLFDDIRDNLRKCNSYKMLKSNNQVTEDSAAYDPNYKNTYLTNSNTLGIITGPDNRIFYNIIGKVILRHQFLGSGSLSSNELNNSIENYINNKLESISNVTMVNIDKFDIETLNNLNS